MAVLRKPSHLGQEGVEQKCEACSDVKESSKAQATLLPLIIVPGFGGLHSGLPLLEEVVFIA